MRHAYMYSGAFETNYPDLADKLASPTNFTSPSAADAWIAERLAGRSDADKSKVIGAYHAAVESASRKRLDDLSRQFSEIEGQLNKSGFELSYVEIGKWSWAPFHLLGLLASVALLSLGAPFWFNILKSLTNLRPLLAKEVGQDSSKSDSNKTS